MAVKPTVLPRWANVGGSLATPVSGKQDIGWLPGEEPPAQWFNWLGLHTYNWTKWLDDHFGTDASFTPEANGHVILSGTGLYKHGARTIVIPAVAFFQVGNMGFDPSTFRSTVSANATTDFCAPIPLEAGKRILTASAIYNVNSAGAITPGISRVNLAGLTGAVNAVWTGSADATGAAIEAQTNASVNHTILATDAYYATVRMTNTANRFYGMILTFDQP